MQVNVQWQSLNSFTYRLVPHTDTHTQKEMELAGLYWTLQPRRIGKLGSESGRVPGRLMRFYQLALVEHGVHGREWGSPARALQRNPPRWDSNPRTRIQRALPGSYERPGQP